MTTRDEPLDPQEVLEAAEAAHLAERRTVSIRRDAGQRGGAAGADRPTVQLGQDPAAGQDSTVGREHAEGFEVRQTVRLDRPTVALPRQRPSNDAGRRAPLPLAAAVAAVWAVLISFAPVAVVVLLLPAADQSSPAVGGQLRVAAAGWLLAHGVPLQTAAGPIGLAPLALAALAAWRVVRAGVHVTRARGARGTGSVSVAVAVALAVAMAYGAVGLLAAVAAGGSGWGPELPRAGLTLAAFGFVFASYGSWRATGALPVLIRRVPAVLREGGRAGVVAAAGVLAAGAATAGTALALGGGPAADIVAAYDASVAGQAGLTLLCLAYAPNLAGWAAAYLVGPGFAVGTDTLVRSSEVVLGPLPALPVFAALPTAPLPGLGAALLAAPVVAGGVGGWLLVWPTAAGRAPLVGAPRGQASLGWAGWIWPVLGAMVSGVIAGLLLGLVAFASGGPLGDGRLAMLGPDPVLVAVFTAATVTVGALLGAATAAGLARFRQR